MNAHLPQAALYHRPQATVKAVLIIAGSVREQADELQKLAPDGWRVTTEWHAKQKDDMVRVIGVPVEGVTTPRAFFLRPGDYAVLDGGRLLRWQSPLFEEIHETLIEEGK